MNRWVGGNTFDYVDSLLNMVISLQREYFCLINVGGKTWQGCAYAGCTQHLDLLTVDVQADHCWCARNESRARMIYKMQSDQIAGHISLLETKNCGKNMLTSNATNILRWHARNEARIIYTGKGPKSEKNLALGFNTRFLLEDQNEET